MSNLARYFHRRSRKAGFALVVTLSLMILLTVIAVGLLSLSSISLRSSSQSNARQTAQANARMAMTLAIGQLQLYAGSDQRVSATADMASGAGGIAAADSAPPLNAITLDAKPNGLSAVQPGTRHWTGIWKNRDLADTNFSKLIYTKTASPELVGWLISGNEAQPNSVTPATPAHGLSASGNVADVKKTVILAGSKTAGNETADPRYHVSAPLVDIMGSGASASKRIGRYGWWVGDEGVKAKFNLVTPYGANDVATDVNSSSQRSGWEVVAGFDKYPLPGTAGNTSLSHVISLPQISLLAGIPKTSLSFHSATTESFGVLADCLQGGLKLDLTSYLRQTLPTTPPLKYPNGISAAKNIIPATVAPLIKGPKWEALKDFSEFAAKNVDGSGNLKVKGVAANSAGNVQAAIAPTVVDLRLLMGARLFASPSGSDNFQVHPCAKLAITVANPYSYPLTWDGLDIEITNSLPGNNIEMSRIWEAAGRPAFISKDGSEPALFLNAVFQIPSATLPPGAAVAYTNAGPVERVAASTSKVTVTMSAMTGNASSDQNFRNALILKHNSTNSVAGNSMLKLDVRESTVTTQIDVTMKPKGSTSILRKLERLELDNAEFTPTQRRFGSNTTDGKLLAKSYTDPVPLQLYRFQISQPGVDYGSLLPSSGDLGLRGSTLRTYADFNLQATRFRKPIIAYNPPPYFMALSNSSGDFQMTAPGGGTGPVFAKNLAISPVRWGRSESGSEKTILFSPLKAGDTLVSLAQLQHADLTADDIYASVAHQPGNAVGNSYASPFVTRDKILQQRTDYQITNYDRATPTPTNYYDLSYLLNASLWDTYFFSTVPATASTKPLNPKIIKIDESNDSPDLRSGEKASSLLLVNGAFNVNSTSKDAWKAFLAGCKHLKHPADTTNSTDALFPRSLGQKSPAESPPSGDAEDSFAGFRRLTDIQIDLLAEEITRQVRLRGPFVSVGQFVNRALVGLTVNKELGRSGALQTALDKSGINIKPDASQSVFADVAAPDDKLSMKVSADLTGSAASTFQPSDLWPSLSRDKNPGSVASILADKEMLTDAAYRPEQGFRSTGIPGWVTQADLLQVIGPSITARSDTFKIRSYGEALDAAGNVTAKAWCEAVVQRIPDYVDPSDAASERDTDLVPTNKTFGRKLKLVSFRWLSSNEI